VVALGRLVELSRLVGCCRVGCSQASGGRVVLGRVVWDGWLRCGRAVVLGWLVWLDRLAGFSPVGCSRPVGFGRVVRGGRLRCGGVVGFRRVVGFGWGVLGRAGWVRQVGRFG
jgi:hypothetical protein